MPTTVGIQAFCLAKRMHRAEMAGVAKLSMG
jgi:hypothetical protein